MNMRQLVCTIAGILAMAGLNGCKTEHSELSDGRVVDENVEKMEPAGVA